MASRPPTSPRHSLQRSGPTSASVTPRTLQPAAPPPLAVADLLGGGAGPAGSPRASRGRGMAQSYLGPPAVATRRESAATQPPATTPSLALSCSSSTPRRATLREPPSAANLPGAWRRLSASGGMTPRLRPTAGSSGAPATSRASMSLAPTGSGLTANTARRGSERQSSNGPPSTAGASLSATEMASALKVWERHVLSADDDPVACRRAVTRSATTILTMLLALNVRYSPRLAQFVSDVVRTDLGGVVNITGFLYIVERARAFHDAALRDHPEEHHPLLDAFVAVGGNEDATGSVDYASVAAAVDRFHLQYDVLQLLQGMDDDHDARVDFDEFEAALRPDDDADSLAMRRQMLASAHVHEVSVRDGNAPGAATAESLGQRLQIATSAVKLAEQQSRGGAAAQQRNANDDADDATAAAAALNLTYRAQRLVQRAAAERRRRGMEAVDMPAPHAPLAAFTAATTVPRSETMRAVSGVISSTASRSLPRFRSVVGGILHRRPVHATTAAATRQICGRLEGSGLASSQSVLVPSQHDGGGNNRGDMDASGSFKPGRSSQRRRDVVDDPAVRNTDLRIVRSAPYLLRNETDKRSFRARRALEEGDAAADGERTQHAATDTTAERNPFCSDGEENDAPGRSGNIGGTGPLEVDIVSSEGTDDDDDDGKNDAEVDENGVVVLSPGKGSYNASRVSSQYALRSDGTVERRRKLGGDLNAIPDSVGHHDAPPASSASPAAMSTSGTAPPPRRKSTTRPAPPPPPLDPMLRPTPAVLMQGTPIVTAASSSKPAQILPTLASTLGASHRRARAAKRPPPRGAVEERNPESMRGDAAGAQEGQDPFLDWYFAGSEVEAATKRQRKAQKALEEHRAAAARRQQAEEEQQQQQQADDATGEVFATDGRVLAPEGVAATAPLEQLGFLMVPPSALRGP